MSTNRNEWVWKEGRDERTGEQNRIERGLSTVGVGGRDEDSESLRLSKRDRDNKGWLGKSFTWHFSWLFSSFTRRPLVSPSNYTPCLVSAAAGPPLMSTMMLIKTLTGNGKRTKSAAEYPLPDQEIRGKAPHCFYPPTGHLSLWWLTLLPTCVRFTRDISLTVHQITHSNENTFTVHSFPSDRTLLEC